MSETIYFIGTFLLGLAAGLVLSAQYYGTVIYGLTKANTELTRKLHAIEKKPASEREVEYFKRGGHVALQTVHDFAKHRLEIDPSQLKEVMDEPLP
jgi:hypothetical protein